jgi:hypothetical protein
LLHMLCVILGASLFLFSVFFYFVCCNKWLDHTIFVLERDTLRFYCLEHSSFHSYRSTFASTVFSLCFSPLFFLELVSYL